MFAAAEKAYADTSEERYKERLFYFLKDKKALPRLRHYLLWLLHNCIAHPILALCVSSYTIEFHELTSQWLNHTGVRINFLRIMAPKISNKFSWFMHNFIAHIAIGLFPFKPIFKFHDKTAKWMNVSGWV